MRALFDSFYQRLIKKNNVYKDYNLYKQSQYWPINEIEEYQLKLFQKLWTHATNNVEFYKQFAKKEDLFCINSLKELELLPISTKELFRSGMENFCANNLEKYRFIKKSTSGSSGSNFNFYSDRNQMNIARSFELRRFDWMGVSPFALELMIWGSNWDIQNGWKNKLKDWKNNKIRVSGYNLSNSDILDIYKLMATKKPKTIKSYPSILSLIVDVFEINNLKYKPKAIHIGGEKLYGIQKEKIENFFDTKVYDFYGARDMPNVAQSCSHGNGLHIFSENVIVEVVDDYGKPIEEGEGDLVITNLHNYAMPFIRYKIGDRARISKYKICKCGRTLPLLDEIIGRSFELIKFPNGNRVMGTFWTLLFKTVEGIEDFQIIQEQDGKIFVYFTVKNDFKPESIPILINRIKEYGGKLTMIEFIKKDKIEITKAGKRNFIISKFKN